MEVQATGEHLGRLKDLEISKYKRESKARMPIKFCCLIFVNCGLFSFLNIKKVKILVSDWLKL
jgi:hypothetical protein